MLILTAEDMLSALPMEALIPAMKRAFAALSAGRAEVPLRARLPVPPHQATCLFMPAYLQDEETEALTVKVVSLFPGNLHRGLAFIQAAVLVLEADTGRPLALLEGSTLTARRTGAASGAATDLLARAESQVAAIIGAGVQGRTQLEAICAVRSIVRAWIYDINPRQARAFVAEMAGKGRIPADLRVAESPRQAIAEADIVCAATTASQPVFNDADLKVGAHINGVGSYSPEMREIPTETILRARVVVDARTAALAEAGDLIQPIQRGQYTAEQVYAELGEIVLGWKPGRTDSEMITFFKSVGVAVQDAAAAALALKRAGKLGLGQEVKW